MLNYNFQLFRAISVPTQSPSGYIYIEPKQKYLLTTFSREQTSYLTQHEFNSCFKNYNRHFFCNTHNPVFISHAKDFDCENKLLAHATTVPASCLIKQTVTADYWIQLSNNEYLFVLNEPQQVDLICDLKLTTHPIHDTGILGIPPKCQLRSKNILINSGNFDREPRLDIRLHSVNKHFHNPT